MTDELQYVKLAISVADTHSPVPTIHGTSVALANQVYPILLAPVYASLGSEDAFRAAHVLNAVVMASAALPAYLLGRELLSRGWSSRGRRALGHRPLDGAHRVPDERGRRLSRVPLGVPRLLRAVVEPRARRDLLAVAALGFAILTRTQFAALALVLPLAILVEELASSRRRHETAVALRPRLASGTRAAWRRHRLLWSLYAAAAIVAAGVVVAGSGDRLWGAYSVTVESGWILPSGTWGSAARHLAVVGIGCGIVPLLLGGGWLLSAVARPREGRSRHSLRDACAHHARGAGRRDGVVRPPLRRRRRPSRPLSLLRRPAAAGRLRGGSDRGSAAADRDRRGARRAGLLRHGVRAPVPNASRASPSTRSPASSTRR